MLGLGVMIQTLGGNEETVNAVKSALNKTIEKVWLKENELLFKFTDGTNLKLYDDGQSCCETRYMRTDDDLSEYSGAKLLDFELKNAPNQEDEYGDHEIQFLDVKTDKGIFQMANHNEHNGYYGGFWIVARVF
ncbi:MAG: hypothetical protein KGZ87_07950 [Bacteroidetes bacterium]|nr:hypothetical protein [Bacteroidota bacterium]